MLKNALTKGPTVLLFLAFLCFPLFVQFTNLPKIYPLEEYRKLAPRPAAREYFGAGKADILGYTAKLNTWYSDQFATRPMWVRLYTQALYSLFGESDQIHVGPNNWMFYRSVIDRELPSTEKIPPEGRKAMIEHFAKLSHLLEQRGVTLYVMPLALKPRYYPEFLPLTAQHVRSYKFYDTFMDELVADKRVRVIDTRKQLEAAKASGLQIFHKTDFHWTDPAGALAVKPLLHEIGASEGKLSVTDSWNYEIYHNPKFKGGQGRALPLVRTPIEDSIETRIVSPQTPFDIKTNVDGYERSGQTVPPDDKLLSPIFVFGDSFFDAPERAGFYNLFSGFTRARIFSNDLTEAWRHRVPGVRYMLAEYISVATYGEDKAISEFITALEADPNL